VCGRWIKPEGFSKAPPDVMSILTAFPDKKFIKLGLPLSIENIVEHLSTCTLLVSIDNGIGHIARSVGCPHVLIEHEWDVERGFPVNQSNYHKAKGTQEAIKKIRNTHNGVD